MYRSIYLLFLLLLSVLPVSSQTVALDSPIYLGALLVDKLDLKDMAETCRYYNFTEAPAEDDFTVFISPAGEKIRFKINNTYPVVEVTTKDKPSSIKKRLSNVGFQKTAQGYERGSNFYSRKTLCIISSSPILLHFYKISTKDN